jgi:ribose transport system substrate-binding protein
MKKLAVVALTFLALSACNRDKKRVIAVIPKGNAHIFWQSVHAGSVSTSRETGVDIIWDGPASETDYTGQLKVVDAMINRRVDAIVLAPIDSKAMVGVVERAAAENIPVVIMDSGIDTDKFVAQVATDNYHAGEMGAERLAKILGGKGKVAVLGNMPGSASTVARESGFEDYMKKNQPGIQIVEKQFGNAEVATSLTKAENILTAHPDLDGVFGIRPGPARPQIEAENGRVRLEPQPFRRCPQRRHRRAGGAESVSDGRAGRAHRRGQAGRKTGCEDERDGPEADR